MKRIYFILAIAASAIFTGCSNDVIEGEEPQAPSQETGKAITFGSSFKAVTRAEGEAAANLLGKAFKVYGVKQNNTTNTNYDKVFVNYTVKYDATKVGNTDYNYGWYYVGAEANQYIKYWDYKSADYHFVAGSPVANFTYALDNNGDIATATVTGLGGRLNHTTSVASNHAAVYVADPKVVAKTAYNTEVEFSFHALLSKVRVGIYETIPGYRITDIKFYNNASSPSSSKYITLNGTDSYFQGGGTVTGTVTYNWTTPGYTFDYTSSTITKDKCWEGGQFTAGVPAVSSASTDLYGEDNDDDTNGYFTVLPTPSEKDATSLSITCDYTLTSLDGSGETIEIDGATATIPADYTKWLPNYAYTYLFKITDSSLHPITFDAVVVDEIDQGTTTTISSPSITVYQAGNVVENGITYNTSAITIKVMNGTNDVTSNTTIEHVELASFNYGSNYEKLGANGAATTWTSGTPTLTSGKTYVIKATYDTNKIAYFVLVVGTAETGPNNTNP